MTATYLELHRVLVDAQRERSQREDFDRETGEIGWVTHERMVMLEAVNQRRRVRGLPDVHVNEVKRAEQLACGHVDYTQKFALGCAELVTQP